MWPVLSSANGHGKWLIASRSIIRVTRFRVMYYNTVFSFKMRAIKCALTGDRLVTFEEPVTAERSFHVSLFARMRMWIQETWYSEGYVPQHYRSFPTIGNVQVPISTNNQIMVDLVTIGRKKDDFASYMVLPADLCPTLPMLSKF